MVTKEISADPALNEQTLAPDDMQEVSFAAMLEEYTPEPLRQGQYVTGQILQINSNLILANVDSKRTAIVPPRDLENIGQDVLARLSVGDEAIFYVLRTPVGSDDLFVSLNKGFERQDWLEAEARLADKELLTLPVIGHNRGGIVVAFGRLQAFVPNSHIPQLHRGLDPHELAARKADLVGQKLAVKVLEVDQPRGRLVMSARKAQKERRQQRLLALKLKEGESVVGRITNLVKFGAFVDLDGVEGLIHISEIAWHKIAQPADVLTAGEEIEVLVRSVDMEKERVSLSRRALLSSPWELAAEQFTVGGLVEGVVTNVPDFGAFVLIAEGIEGLVHVSEMHGAAGLTPQEILTPGDTILVRILNIQPERERLSLSQRQVSRDEEMEWIWQRQQSAATVPADEEE